MTRTAYLFEIVLVCLFITILMVTNASALRINEVEANPLGSDSGNEWVELYSESEVNLEGYYLENDDGDVFDLSGSFSGYKAIVFTGLWLDNSKERVFIKKDNSTIDETPLLDDAANKDTTNSYCSGSWELIASSKEQSNLCADEEIEETQQEEVQDNEEEMKEEVADEEENEEQEDKEESEEDSEEMEKDFGIDAVPEGKKTKSTIVLGAKKENTITKEEVKEYVSREFYIRTGIVYSFIIFLALLVILLLVRGRNI